MSLVNNLSSILSSCLHCFSLLWCYILFLTHPFFFCLCLLGRFLYVMSSFFFWLFFGRCMVSSVAPSLLFIFRWSRLFKVIRALQPCFSSGKCVRWSVQRVKRGCHWRHNLPRTLERETEDGEISNSEGQTFSSFRSMNTGLEIAFPQ